MRVKLAEIDIDAIERITGLTGYDAVEILFLSGRNPLGTIRVSCRTDSLEAGTIRPLIKDLELPQALEPAEPQPPEHRDLPSVSVVICTKNRPDLLTGTLDSLAHQTVLPMEILVIDNGCQAAVRRQVERASSLIRYVMEPRPGLDVCRNRALSHAKGDIIAFIDDDAVADQFWIQSVAESFRSLPRAGALTGLILPSQLETDAQLLFEANGGFQRGFQRRVMPHDRTRCCGLEVPLVIDATGAGCGCNMAFRSGVIKKLGGFDEALDAGSSLPGAGETDLFYRILRNGYELIYEPRARVRHLHRSTLGAVRRQLAGHYRSLSALLAKIICTESGLPRYQALLYLLWRLVKYSYRPLRSLLGLDPLPFGYNLTFLGAGIIGLGSYQASRWRIHAQTQFKGLVSPSPAELIFELIRHRELIWNMTLRDLKVKYQRSWLGFLWTMLNPATTVAILVTVFSIIVRLPIDHYWAFILSGYFAWNFFSQTLNGGVQAAVGNAPLTRSAYFPQEILVIAATLARLVEFMVELIIVMLFLALFHHQGVPLAYLAVPLLILILFLLAIGIAFTLVTLAVYYSDTIEIIPLITMILFYMSPVFYNIELVPESIRNIYLLNPLASLINLYHEVLYGGQMPDPVVAGLLTGVALMVGFTGYMIFNRKKREFAEIV